MTDILLRGRNFVFPWELTIDLFAVVSATANPAREPTALGLLKSKSDVRQSSESS